VTILNSKKEKKLLILMTMWIVTNESNVVRIIHYRGVTISGAIKVTNK
jgi:hypothetical protein